MNRIFQGLLAALITAGTMLALAAHAYPFTIPTGSSAADDLIVNFDFLSPPQTPAPPYSFVSTSFTLAGAPGFVSFVIDYFGGLDGDDFLFAQPFTLSGTSFTLTGSVNNLEIKDGQFSVGFRMTNGALDLTHAEAIGTFDGVRTDAVQGTLAAVPEPATLALLGMGLAGLGFSRRRALN